MGPPAFSVRVSPALGSGGTRQQVRPGSIEPWKPGSAGGARSELSLAGGTVGTARRESPPDSSGSTEALLRGGHSLRIPLDETPLACHLHPAAVSLGLGGSYSLVSQSNGQPSFSPYHPILGAGTNPNRLCLPRHTELKAQI